jgi:hypothetical protein
MRQWRKVISRLRLSLLLGALAACASAHAAEPAPLPSFAQMEAEGARIGAIRIDPQNIFDLDDPRENGALFRLVNSLHIRTRPEVIEGTLLFRSGDRLSARLIDETERLFRAKRYLYDVDIRPAAYKDGVVDIDVITRDTWSLDLTGKLSRSGGKNATAFGFKDDNLLGTATVLGFEQVSDADRDGWQLELMYPRAFDGWTEVGYAQGRYNDGSRKTAWIDRPFYALDTRWAAGARALDDDRKDAIYNAGEVVAKYRHRQKSAQAYGGWSPGLARGWAQRYSLGVTLEDDAYAIAAGETAPRFFPVDHKVRGPFARYEVIEEQFLKTRNRDQIARTEIVSMGFTFDAKATRAFGAWGSTRSSWLYSAVLTDGLPFAWGHDLHATLKAERLMASTGAPLSHAGVLLRYYAPQSANSSFYALASAERIGTAAAPDQLQIGGDSGLRGYPLRYQAGERRALLTLEQRAYTDWYFFRLVRVGGAVFFDVGRAWGGVNQNVENPGWLSDVGVGLRLAIDRAAFANVLHLDVAFPLNRTPEIKAVQYIVKTQHTF